MERNILKTARTCVPRRTVYSTATTTPLLSTRCELRKKEGQRETQRERERKKEKKKKTSRPLSGCPLSSVALNDCDTKRGKVRRAHSTD